MAKNKSNIKEELDTLPKELREAYRGFNQNKPDASTPSYMMDIFSGASEDEEFSIELNENTMIEIAEWAFDKQGKRLPDDAELEKVKTFATLIYRKVFLFQYETGSKKSCPTYTDNDKVKIVGISDRKKLNDLCSKEDDTKEKGRIYAEHFGITDEFERLYDWDKSLFYIYCSENKAENTKVGKN